MDAVVTNFFKLHIFPIPDRSVPTWTPIQHVVVWFSCDKLLSTAPYFNLIKQIGIWDAVITNYLQLHSIIINSCEIMAQSNSNLTNLYFECSSELLWSTAHPGHAGSIIFNPILIKSLYILDAAITNLINCTPHK